MIDLSDSFDGRIERVLVWFFRIILVLLLFLALVRGEPQHALIYAVVLVIHIIIYLAGGRLQMVALRRWGLLVADVVLAVLAFYLTGDVSGQAGLLGFCVAAIIAARLSLWHAMAANALVWLLFTAPFLNLWIRLGQPFLPPIIGNLVAYLALTFVIGYIVSMEARRAKTERDAARRLRQLTTVHEVGWSITSTLEMESVLELVMAKAVEILNAEAGSLLLLEEDKDDQGPGELVFRVVAGPIADTLIGQRLSTDVGIAGRVFQSCQGEYSNAPQADPDWSAALDTLTDSETRAILCVPLCFRERSVGVLEVINKLDGTPFHDEDLELLSTFAAQASIAVENARLYDEVSKLYKETDETLNRRLQELATIEEIDHELGTSLDYDRIINLVLERAIDACAATSGVLGILSADGQGIDVRQHRRAESGGRLEQTTGEWPVERGVIGRVVRTGESTLVDDVRTDQDYGGTAEVTRSEIAVPIKREERVIGVLSLESERLGAFSKDELRFLEHLADHAGIAIENAHLFREEQQRVQMLSAVSDISREMGSSLELERTLKLILDRVKVLVDYHIAEICLWDETQQVMITAAGAGSPHYSAQAGDLYHLDEGYTGWIARHQQELVIPDTAARKDVRPKIVSEDAPVRSYLGLPLRIGETFVGTLELASDQTGAYTEDLVEILSIFADQAAVAIHNARLFEAQQRQAREQAILFETSAALSSSLDLNEVLGTIGRKVADALDVTTCSISDWDPERNEVRTLVDEDAVPRELSGDVGNAYSLDDYPATAQVLHTRRPHVVQVSDPDADPSERALMEELGYKSLLMLPMIARDRVVGLLELFEDRHPREFSDDDIRLGQILANQAASALENARLYEYTDDRLRLRVEELMALQRTTQELNATLALDSILEVVLESAIKTTAATHGNVMLMDMEIGNLTLRASQGYTEEEEAAIEGSLLHPEQDSLALQVVETGEARTVDDAAQEESVVCVREDTRSALVVPIFYESLVVGLINLRHTEVAAFDQEALTFVQALAEQAAVAIGNALRFEDQIRANTALRRRNEQMNSLLTVGQKLRADVPLEDTLEEVAYAIQETVGFDVVMISVVEDLRRETPILERVAAAGLPLHVFEEAKQVHQPLELYERLFCEEYRQGLCYFFPYHKREHWGADLHIIVSASGDRDWQEGQWHPHDMLLVPLRGVGGRLIGHISVDEPRDGRRPSRQTLEALAIFANQAAIAVENANLFEQTRRRVAELATVNQIGRAISSALDEDQLSELIYSQVSSLLDARSFFIALYDADRELICIEFAVEQGRRQSPKYLELGQGLTSYVLTTGSPVLLGHDVEEFLQEYDLTAEGPLAKSWLGVPMMAEHQVIGAIAVQSYEREDAFDEGHLELLTTIAGQAAVAFQNASLFEERERRIGELGALNEIAQAISSTLDMEALLELVYRQVSRLMDTTNFYIALYDHEKDEITFPFTVDPGQREDWSPRPGGTGLTGQVIEDGEALLLPTGAAGLHREAGQEIQTGLCRSWLGVPMIAGDQVLGVIAVQSYEQEYVYDQDAVRLLSTVAAQAAVAVRNAQLYQQIVGFSADLEDKVEARTRELEQAALELRSERDRAETLYRITSELGTTLDLERVLVRALQLFDDTLGVEHGTVMLLNQETGFLDLKATLDPEERLPRAGLPTPLRQGVGLAGWVLDNRKPALVTDITKDERWVDIPGMEVDARSVVIAPLSLGGGDILGVLTLGHPEVGYFTEEHLQLISAGAAQVAVAVSNSDLYAFITDQADQLGATLQAMQAEADRSRSILESIADGVLVLDHKGQIMLVNPAAEELLDVSAMVLEGEHFRHMLGMGETQTHRELAQGLYTELRRRLDDVETEGADLQASAVRLVSGHRVLAVNIAPLLTTIGETPGIVAALRDVSREAEVERLKNEFISTVSHELRTPMTSIKGYTDLLFLGMAGGLSDAQRSFLQIIKSNADRLTALVNDILDISRIETGRLQLTIEPLDLGRLISETVTSFQEQYRDKGLALEWEEPKDFPEVRGDAARVTQVLSNLIANAWQYTPEGGSVTLSIHRLDGFLRVDVADTGIGISANDLSRVFDRFYRVDHPVVQEAEGTGLGLSIVKMFVEMLGGDIWVESELDVGSTFSFTIPLVTAEKPEEEVIQPDLIAEEVPAAMKRRPKVLVVESNRELALSLRRRLESEGYQVLLAGSGEDALWLAQEEQPRLITLDIMLPDMDGFVVLERLRKHPGTAPIPVIVISVLSETDTGYALGAVDYVVKPFEEDKLLRAVQLALSPREKAEDLSLLVVDDDPDIVTLLEHALAFHGYQVRTAMDGHQALAEVEAGLPDLILLDLKMPRMDGYEVIRRLKSNEDTRSVPIVVITASPVDKERDKVRVLGMGAAQYITKPLSIETLVDEIKEAITERQQE